MGSTVATVAGAVVLATVLFGGCIDTKLAQCGAKLCPPGAVCVPNRSSGDAQEDQCHPEDLVNACVGEQDGTRCVGGIDAICIDRVCVQP
ncbi:MAG: hypothetical protein KJO07_05265, partial [Deltaproteobacteria bacterium]|nr:hypothetical protein [Deltaproteobacteria bacterium]